MDVSLCSINTQGRVRKEFHDLRDDPIKNCTICIVDNDITKWRVFILGPIGSLYENGRFELLISMLYNYHSRGPNIIFITKIYYPNVYRFSGELQRAKFQDEWDSTKNVRLCRY